MAKLPDAPAVQSQGVNSHHVPHRLEASPIRCNSFFAPTGHALHQRCKKKDAHRGAHQSTNWRSSQMSCLHRRGPQVSKQGDTGKKMQPLLRTTNPFGINFLRCTAKVHNKCNLNGGLLWCHTLSVHKVNLRFKTKIAKR